MIPNCWCVVVAVWQEGKFDSGIMEVLNQLGGPEQDPEAPADETDCEYWPEGPRADAVGFILGHRVMTEVRDQVRRDPDPDAARRDFYSLQSTQSTQFPPLDWRDDIAHSCSHIAPLR